MHLPTRLYESLPLLYSVVAVMALAALGPRPLVVVCALMLFAASALIHQRRRAHRMRLAQARAREAREARRSRFR